jgi:DNA-binding CsgD family transcriptional regulator
MLGVAGAAYAIFVVAPGRPPIPSVRALRETFGLTSMEASVALALARGASLRQVAADNQVGVVTVRTHVAHLFEKTGTARQAELVRLILSLAPPM